MKLRVAKRRRGALTPPEMKEHIVHVGEITFAWTQLQSAFFNLFLLLIEHHGLAHGLWHCIRSDATQQQMLIAAAEIKLRNKKRILDRLIWQVDCAGKLATARNDLTHTGLLSLPHPLEEKNVAIPDFIAGRFESAKRLAAATPARWKAVIGDLIALESDARTLAVRIMTDPKKPIGPWPRKPKLRSSEVATRGGRAKKRPAKKNANRQP